MQEINEAIQNKEIDILSTSSEISGANYSLSSAVNESNNNNKMINFSLRNNNCYSDFDANAVLKEFKRHSVFSETLDEKTKEKVFNLKTGTKIKTKFSVDVEKLKNWKFDRKLIESKFFIFLFFITFLN